MIKNKRTRNAAADAEKLLGTHVAQKRVQEWREKRLDMRSPDPLIYMRLNNSLALVRHPNRPEL